MEDIDSRLEDALFTARLARQLLEAKLTEDQFIDDTTSTFVCISWRKGPEDKRKVIEDMLAAFEREGDTLKRIEMLKELKSTASQYSFEADDGKFKTALTSVKNDADKLIKNLMETEDYQKYQQEEQEAERLRLLEVARLERLEQERVSALPDLDHAGRVESFKRAHGTSPVLDKLLAGIEAGGMAKLAANFKTIGFTYSMVAVAGRELITGRTDGDCSTVSNAMALIASEILQVPTRVSGCQDMLADSTEMTIDGAKAPNGYQAGFWVFANHYWVESGSGNFDPLFGRALDRSTWHLLVGKSDHRSMNLTVENYGGKYKVVFLIGDAGMIRILAGDITESIWRKHCTKANISTSFSDFRDAI